MATLAVAHHYLLLDKISLNLITDIEPTVAKSSVVVLLVHIKLLLLARNA